MRVALSIFTKHLCESYWNLKTCVPSSLLLYAVLTYSTISQVHINTFYLLIHTQMLPAAGNFSSDLQWYCRELLSLVYSMLCSVMIRASDLWMWSTGCEFDSRPKAGEIVPLQKPTFFQSCIQDQREVQSHVMPISSETSETAIILSFAPIGCSSISFSVTTPSSTSSSSDSTSSTATPKQS